ncbi:MAG: hypothetical protein ACK4OM_02300 [Alphaproteobacteria bacterium]
MISQQTIKDFNKAACDGNLESINKVLANANTEGRNQLVYNNNYLAFTEAMSNGKFEVADTICNLITDQDKKYEMAGRAFRACVSKNNTKVMEKCLELIPDLAKQKDAITKDITGALKLAAQKGHSDSIEYLVFKYYEFGIDVKIITNAVNSSKATSEFKSLIKSTTLTIPAISNQIAFAKEISPFMKICKNPLNKFKLSGNESTFPEDITRLILSKLTSSKDNLSYKEAEQVIKFVDRINKDSGSFTKEKLSKTDFVMKLLESRKGSLEIG